MTTGSKRVFAIAAHPDDIEFMMGGTLILLGRAGYELHYMNIANGSCGSSTLPPEEIAAVRLVEAKNAADSIGARFHSPLVDDMKIYYEDSLIRTVAAIVRQVDPEIVLLQSPQDYMEDHQNASRIGMTAAFCRNIPNFETTPPTPPLGTDAAVYHALPHGVTSPLLDPIIPHFYVNVESVLEDKRRMLGYHKSQKEWLDVTQGMDNYVYSMEQDSAEVGQMSGIFSHAEGWRRHLHYGFGPKDFDPVGDALANVIHRG